MSQISRFCLKRMLIAMVPMWIISKNLMIRMGIDNGSKSPKSCCQLQLKYFANQGALFVMAVKEFTIVFEVSQLAEVEETLEAWFVERPLKMLLVECLILKKKQDLEREM